MELWDIYDKCFEKTGKLHIRGNKLEAGQFHLVVSIFPINSKNQVLVQKRNPNLKLMPGEWAATGGSAITGESPFEAAKRELKEELGIDATVENAEMIALFKRIDSFTSLWVVHIDVDRSELKLQEEEVADAKWVTIQEFQKMVRDGIFHNYRYMDWLLNYLLYSSVMPQNGTNTCMFTGNK